MLVAPDEVWASGELVEGRGHLPRRRGAGLDGVGAERVENHEAVMVRAVHADSLGEPSAQNLPSIKGSDAAALNHMAGNEQSPSAAAGPVRRRSMQRVVGRRPYHCAPRLVLSGGDAD